MSLSDKTPTLKEDCLRELKKKQEAVRVRVIGVWCHQSDANLVCYCELFVMLTSVREMVKGVK